MDFLGFGSQDSAAWKVPWHPGTKSRIFCAPGIVLRPH